MSNIKSFGTSVKTAYMVFIQLFGAVFDKLYLDSNVPMSKHVRHRHWFEHFEKNGNHKDIKFLKLVAK